MIARAGLPLGAGAGAAKAPVPERCWHARNIGWYCRVRDVCGLVTTRAGPARGADGQLSILGTRVLRTEDPKFLTTGGVYTEDVVDDRLDGAYHVFFVRSPIAHARINSIDVSAALAAPGVVAAFTGADLAELPVIPPSAAGLMNVEMTQRLLAIDKVRFVGEPVAVVVTEHPYQGEDAIELVEVDYDPLPAVLGLRAGRQLAAVRGGGHQRRRQLGRGVRAEAGPVRGLRGGGQPHDRQPAGRARADGDPGRAPRSGARTARLTAWIPNQGAQGTRDALAKPARPGSRPRSGSSRRTSAARSAPSSAPTPSTPWSPGSRAQLGHPATVDRDQVREPDRDDPRPGPAAHGHDRRQPGRERARLPAGDRPGRGRLPEDRRHPAVPHDLDDAGPYDIPKAEAIAKVVVTNTTPIGAYRGAGRPEATAALERAMDLFAAEIGVDPADVRRKNLLPPFTEPHRTAFGALYDTGDYVAALDKALGGGRLRRPAQGAGQSGGRAVTSASSASAWPATSRSPAWATAKSRRRGERHRRGASRRDRDDPDRHLAARPGARHRLGDARQRGARHPGREDHAQVGRHRPDPRGRRHRRVAQPAAGRRCGAAGVQGADRDGAAAGRGPARGQRRRPGLRQEPQRVRGGR